MTFGGRLDTTAHLVVKLGESYEEESEEILVLPMADAVLDMSWLLYEYIELSLPFQRVHADAGVQSRDDTPTR